MQGISPRALASARTLCGAAAAENEAIDAGAPVEAHPVRLEPRAERGQDLVQTIGADVRARVVQDLGRRAAGDQLLEQRDLERVSHARVELAVGVGAGAALAEEQVRLGIGKTRALEGVQRAAAIAQRVAAIHEVDGHAVARQHERREEPCGPSAEHRHALAGERRVHARDLDPPSLGRAHHASRAQRARKTR